jgi:hypothetical protein
MTSSSFAALTFVLGLPPIKAQSSGAGPTDKEFLFRFAAALRFHPAPTGMQPLPANVGVITGPWVTPRVHAEEAANDLRVNCYSDAPSSAKAKKLVCLVGSLLNRNISAAYFILNGRWERRALFPAPSCLAVSAVANEVIGGLRNLQKSQEQGVFLPAPASRWSSLEGNTLNTLTAFTKPYEQVFESEIGALIYIGYRPGPLRSSRGGVSGDGETTIFVITPGPRMNSVLRYVSRQSNFWSNDQARRDFVSNVLFTNRANQKSKVSFEYELPSDK